MTFYGIITIEECEESLENFIQAYKSKVEVTDKVMELISNELEALEDDNPDYEYEIFIPTEDFYILRNKTLDYDIDTYYIAEFQVI